MKTDDRPDYAIRLEQARSKRFKSPMDAARFHGWKYETYIQHEQGIRGISRAAGKYARAFRVSEAWLLTGEGDGAQKVVPLMGYVGAGAEIEPDFEQVPPEGLSEIDVPIPLPAEMIAFQVKGISMLPRYDEGDVIVVWKEQKRGTDSFLGEEAAVRTKDGRRFLKTIRRGERAYRLESWNAHPIEDVEIDWVGEIYVLIRAGQLRRQATANDRQLKIA